MGKRNRNDSFVAALLMVAGPLCAIAGMALDGAGKQSIVPPFIASTFLLPAAGIASVARSWIGRLAIGIAMIAAFSCYIAWLNSQIQN